MFPRQIIQYHSNPSLCPTHNAKEVEVDCFYKDLQHLIELTPKMMSFSEEHQRGLECKVGSQETPGITGKFGLGVQNEAG